MPQQMLKATSSMDMVTESLGREAVNTLVQPENAEMLMDAAAPMAAETATKAAGAVANETIARAPDVIYIAKNTPLEYIGFWFLLGAVFAIVVFLVWDMVKKK